MKHDQTSHQPIRMTGECSIQAAAAPKEGEAAKLPTIKMNVYNGGKMHVSYWGDVVVDLAGMKVSDKVPILYGHDTRSIDAVVGQTTKVVADKTLSAEGEVMGVSDLVAKVTGLAKNGFSFQVSMGADPSKTRDVQEGEAVEVNGQTIQGPYVLVSESTLNEISILPLGADKATSAAIAAEHQPEGMTMKKYDKDGKEIPATAEDIRAEAVAEQARIGDIRRIAAEHADIQAQAVKEGWDTTKTELAVKDAIIAAQKKEIAASKVQNERPEAPGINAGAQPEVTAAAIEAATAIRAGFRAPEKTYDQKTLDAASFVMGRMHSITDLFRTVLAMDGKAMQFSRHDTREFLRAAFSSRSLSNILSSLANKFILQGYGTVEQTWRKVTAIRPVVDFKQQNGVRLVMSSLLQALGPGGEIKHGSLSDESATIQADTKALMLGITRKDIINDDLGALTDLPQRFGYAAARTFNTDFWAVFEAAVATMFTTGEGSHLNKTTGALTLANLKVAEKLFLELKDADGNPLGTEATMLLCSPANAAAARELYTATNLVGGTSKDPNINIYAGMFAPAVSRYLSANPWYLLASPMAMPLMRTAFLNGREEPFVESSDADFDTLGIQLRCWYDYGNAAGEWRAGVQSTGV